MLLPLCYELWAFPYRLALGAPSTDSKICAADAFFDCLFLLDIFVALCTALPPAHPGDPAITSFSSIARRYFSVTFGCYCCIRGGGGGRHGGGGRR